jgi:hypothetical protein
VVVVVWSLKMNQGLVEDGDWDERQNMIERKKRRRGKKRKRRRQKIVTLE